MRNGQYRHLISLQRPTDTNDSFGQPVHAWNEITKVWSNISPPSLKTVRGASEAVVDGAVIGLDTVIFTMRPRTDLDTTCRIVYGTTVYDIKSVRLDNRRTELSIFAEVGGSNG